MAKLECALAEAKLKPMAEPPLLSVVIPSYKRTHELRLAVESIVSQLNGGLEDKVEVIVSDNASGGETLELIREMAVEYDRVSYLAHARDEGGYFNLFAAPWRARGRYTWVFGSDDVLLEGGVAGVVEMLETETPAFLTLNKRAAHADLSGLVWERANSVPDARFNGFADLFAALGVNQVAFLSCQIEDTARARALDPTLYLRTETRHPHVAAYLDKHHDGVCVYSAMNQVVHRLDNSLLPHYHGGNFLDYASTLPCLMWSVMERLGTPKDLFERATGYKRIETYDAPDVTFVDAIFENMLRAARFGGYLGAPHKYTLEQILDHCRPHRRDQFAQIWELTQQLRGLENDIRDSQARLEAQREQVMQASTLFTRPPAA